MKQVQLIQEISTLLLQFSNEVKEKGKLKLNDINIISEDVLVPILSIVYDTKLKNLNDEQANFPGIDLVSDDHITYGGGSKIAFQITSSNGITKIKKTIKQYIKNKFYEKFDDVFIFILTDKQDNFQKKSVDEIAKIIDNKFSFDLKLNVIDRTNLISKITSLTPINKIQQIHKLLEDQFVYRKKSLLSLELWETDGEIGYGFSNLINSLNITSYNTLIKSNVSDEVNELILLLLKRYNYDFKVNYDKLEDEKFTNLAYKTYLKAAFEQAQKSYLNIQIEVKNKIPIDQFNVLLSDLFTDLKCDLNESDFPLVNDPINHPAIRLIKTTIIKIFERFGVNKEQENLFIKNFNENIDGQLIETFGSVNYEKHLSDTNDKWIRKNEMDFLIKMKGLAKLGFVDGEELEYQETFGSWKDVRQYGSFDEDLYYDHSLYSSKRQLGNLNSKEKEVKLVEELIDEYFISNEKDKEDLLNNILFLIADFGKGKTSFLHHYASKLAKNYLTTHEGLFPIYLNLNEYDKYSNSPSLGIISNYLAKAFKIDIKEDYFKKKNYIFLIDSLDECGELNEVNIDKVVKNVVEIQNLDSINQRNNRLIIASRPIAVGLKEQISKYKPFCIKVIDEEENIIETSENYVSVYGFKEEQFDNYVEFALKKYLISSKKTENDFVGISNLIFKKITSLQKLELYSMLYGKVLKESELKRPIFAYMIYKLIISNSNFIDFGKVGVYISFLNQLSRDAKHKDDSNHKVSLKDEFIYRNILHASALLWQYKRQSGEQTSLTKADICRTIEEKEIDKDDRKVLAEFVDIDSIHFLSHSYLGEKENTLHFQHQSFAEILLAEYYLKILIKYSIEENTDLEEARIRLSIGMPTDQTIEFFNGLLALLKESVLGDYKDSTVYAKRELLTPLLASLAIKKHNRKLYSTRLNATWFEKHEEILFSKNKIGKDIINDFPITQTVLNKIHILCQGIINSSKMYFIAEPSRHSILYKNEMFSIKKSESYTYEIDKWLSLIAGNLIVTDVSSGNFFNSSIDPKCLFNMIRNWNYTKGNVSQWMFDLFMGIDMKDNSDTIYYDYLNINGLNFSFSYIKKLILKNSQIRGCNFSNSSFEFFEIEESDISYSIFDNISVIKEEDVYRVNGISGYFSLSFCFFSQGVLFPRKLNDLLKGTTHGIVNFGSDYCVINCVNSHEFFETYFEPFRGVFQYLISIGTSSELILYSFRFESDRSLGVTDNSSNEIKAKFSDFILELENNYKKKPL
ncbi:SMEK domain-containing protein [Algoriphagus aquimarinus]|uniref:SMEK domain-containing protein n=1 Tax=Algoriphagus aquimarinus TaxID=237018 RepID=UPI0030DC4CB0|tara:strand:- start:139906 stop:143661 length:3756 start_codon:yes stop_codon:yes gene_type:complete